MDHSSFDSQFVSFTSEDDGLDNSELESSNGHESLYSTPKLISVSESILTDGEDNTICNESSRSGRSLSISCDTPVSMQLSSRNIQSSRKMLKSWPAKTYNLRFTPSRWNHYEMLMNKNDVMGSAKAAMRVPVSHILRPQTPKRKSGSFTPIGTPVMRRLTDEFKQDVNQRITFSPEKNEDTMSFSSNKNKVRFLGINIESPGSSRQKKKLPITPHAKAAPYIENSEQSIYFEEDTYNSSQTPPSAFVVRKLQITPQISCLASEKERKCLPGNGRRGANLSTLQNKPSRNQLNNSNCSVPLQKIVDVNMEQTTSKMACEPASRISMKVPCSDSKYVLRAGNSRMSFASVKSKLRCRLKTSNLVPKITNPQPFKFRTDDRIKNSEDQEVCRKKKKDFLSSLRHNTPKPEIKRPRITKVQPFNLTTKRKREDGNITEYKSLAQQAQDYIKNAREYKATSFSLGTSSSSMHLVRPYTPKFLTSKRIRPNYAISQHEKEEQEIQEMKAYKFHAQPLDQRILKEAPRLPKVERKPTTVPVPVELETEKRNEQRPKHQDEEKPFVFHAREVPKTILNGPMGIKEKQIKPLTCPQSPAFALKQRTVDRHHYHDLIQEEPYQFKATEVRNVTPFKPHIEKKISTSIEPFSFDAKDKQRMALKEKKIQEEYEREKKMRVFRARPLPASILETKKKQIPDHLKKKVTTPKGFSFHTDRVVQKRSSESQSDIENVPPFLFKAEPPRVLKKAPFQPKKPTKKVVVPREFQLSTQTRAQKRQQFEEKKKRLEAEQNELIRQKELEEEQKLEEEMRILRAQTVHKAQPIRNYKPVVLKPSEKPLTNPFSPRFATEDRIMTRTLSFSSSVS